MHVEKAAMAQTAALPDLVALVLEAAPVATVGQSTFTLSLFLDTH